MMMMMALASVVIETTKHASNGFIDSHNKYNLPVVEIYFTLNMASSLK